MVSKKSDICRYPFEIPLPKGLPGSYEGKWGGISYALKVILHRPWKFDVEKAESINIKGCVDFNDDPDIVVNKYFMYCA